ncbi:hypothetical protein TPHA_0K02170 [Tetrapisispora phaffii CBS 4417]|uniref:Creatinase N-terminal domain-containing protein n=1 Tax=Tetrapisispora phaffii (strain ATCC 24235 / CBS 4417 / NBRC 1672 / NRRL Y-8282 / UCD 70-5) TaxID=1071381 RepID=G8BZM0_TETPH|nr:hypothetical protein TPHA_0K02170 [Tetrapisispora phaffii CBS 4417]CCE65348.1 hypothetical protein TPHA_0K02170 [Tetrapisispora phaffii CBS 4417]
MQVLGRSNVSKVLKQTSSWTNNTYLVTSCMTRLNLSNKLGFHFFTTSRYFNTSSRTLAMKSAVTIEKLQMLRSLMAVYNIQCYVIPTEEEHQSEYVSKSDERISLISGFTGSAGVVCIINENSTNNIETNVDRSTINWKAILSTDGRYFNQALKEQEDNWQLHKQDIDKSSWQQLCIRETLNLSKPTNNSNLRIGLDPKLLSYDDMVKFTDEIQKLISATETQKITLVAVATNLVDIVWNKLGGKPSRMSKPIYKLDDKYTAKNFESKKV